MEPRSHEGDVLSLLQAEKGNCEGRETKTVLRGRVDRRLGLAHIEVLEFVRRLYGGRVGLAMPRVMRRMSGEIGSRHERLT